MKTIIVLLLSISAINVWAQPITIKFRPDSVIYLYETTGIGSARPLYTAMLQNVAIVNEGNTSVIIKSGTATLLVNGKTATTKRITNETIKQSAGQLSMLQEMGVLELYDFQFQTKQYLNGTTFSKNDTLAPASALVVNHQVLVSDDIPDELEVVFNATTIHGKQLETKKRIKVVNHVSENKYTLPLKGNWTVAAAPSLVSHHRWAAVQEFAFDFIQVGENNLTYKNQGQRLTDYYCYGQSVYSIGNGKVVSVRNDQEENEEILRKPGENEQVYLQRVVLNQQSLLMEGFDKILGNHVIVDHGNGEFSAYVHLKKGSVKVSKGDIVNQGIEIGSVGNSGNSTEPHLHFHISDKPDFVNSRSLPVRFSNVELYPDDNGQITHIHAGQMIRSK